MPIALTLVLLACGIIGRKTQSRSAQSPRPRTPLRGFLDRYLGRRFGINNILGQGSRSRGVLSPASSAETLSSFSAQVMGVNCSGQQCQLRTLLFYLLTCGILCRGTRSRSATNLRPRTPRKAASSAEGLPPSSAECPRPTVSAAISRRTRLLQTNTTQPLVRALATNQYVAQATPTSNMFTCKLQR